jgi:hypothetical protein
MAKTPPATGFLHHLGKGTATALEGMGKSIATVAGLAAAGTVISGLYYSMPIGGGSLRHKFEHLAGWGLGGRILEYHGSDGQLHSGLWCDRCGKHLRTWEVPAVSDRLGEALVYPGEARSLIKRIAFYSIRRGYEKPLSGRDITDVENANPDMVAHARALAEEHRVPAQ